MPMTAEIGPAGTVQHVRMAVTNRTRRHLNLLLAARTAWPSVTRRRQFPGKGMPSTHSDCFQRIYAGTPGSPSPESATLTSPDAPLGVYPRTCRVGVICTR
jgi:hypothetical protein